MSIIITKDGASGSATITGIYKEQEITIATIGQTAHGRIFEVDPITFDAMRHRIGLGIFQNQFELRGDPKEKPVVIRKIRKGLFT